MTTELKNHEMIIRSFEAGDAKKAELLRKKTIFKIFIHFLKQNKVRSGEMSLRERADQLAQPCPCGIFNTDRCQTLISQLADETGAGTVSGT